MSRTLPLLGLLTLAATGIGGIAKDAARPDSTRPVAATSRASVAPASFRFAKSTVEAPEAEPVAPIQLTASDGTGLTLVALEANGVLEPPLAFTELRLTFENPRNEVIEGRFRIALPAGAALSRFAMKIGDAWQEGEVVERQRARRVYEDFLHLRQDPALLEQEAGNEFSARVFPIPARGRKELIVSYSHALARTDEPYAIPLAGLAQIRRLDLRVLLGDRPASGAASNLGGEVSDRRVVELHKRDWTPDRDFEIAQDQVAERPGLRHDHLALVRVAAPVTATPQEITGLFVLVDSSASRALGYATQALRLAELLRGLRDGAGAATPVAVAAFDQEVAPLYEGTAGGFGEAEAQRLLARRPLGASDLEGALAWLAERLPRNNRQYPRVLLVTDGVATAGETETRALKAGVRALRDKGVERLDVLAFGGLRDEAVLRELTTGNLAHDGQRLDGRASIAELGRRLSLACRSGIKVEVAGADWVWPETLDGVQPGDEVLVFADLPARKSVQLSLDGRPAALAGELAVAERPLLERAWVQARIERLSHLRDTAHGNDPDLRRALEIQIAELSVRHRVLSPFTAMLVLETEWDYARFGLDRRALADVLSVGAGGLEVLARTRPILPGRAGGERIAPKAVTPDRRDPLQSLGYAGSANAEDDAEAGMPTGVASGIEGGVPGGTPGGLIGGAPMALAAPPASGEAVQPVEAPGEIPEAPLRVGAGPRQEEPVAEAITEEIRVEPRRQLSRRRAEREEKRSQVAPHSGRFAEVMEYLDAGRSARARKVAEQWIAEAPGDVLALLALGEVWEAAGESAAAARAYGSLIDIFPRRADLRRLAGERLERLGEAGLALAIDTYRKAVEDRPDHPSGHRLLAWALLRVGRFEEAFAALEKGLGEKYPQGRFAGIDQVLREDLGLLAAAWLRAEPARREELRGRLEAHDAELEDQPSLRFVLTWETDANDVDLHVWDRRGAHASYEQKALPSGGVLYADVTTGYGPECFAVRKSAGGFAEPYRLRVHYYNRGPMGYGMGTVQVVRHDGEGRFSIEPRPFVAMADDAMVDLGEVTSTKSGGEPGR